MKKILLGLFSLGVACAVASGQTRGESSAQGLSYQHPDGRFRLRLPAGWVPSDPAPGSAAYFISFQGSAPVAGVLVFVEPLIQPVTTRMYAQGVEQNSLSGLTHYQKLAESFVTVARRQAVWRQFSFSQIAQGMTQPIMAEQYYLVAGDAAYTFHFATYQELYGRMKSQFDEIIRSLEFVAVGPMRPAAPLQTTASYPLIQSAPLSPVSGYPQAKIEVSSLPQNPQEQGRRDGP